MAIIFRENGFTNISGNTNSIKNQVNIPAERIPTK
jgi:hypothetical protein